ncbi:IclR family transcriptional regulator domain-containing protein [Corynebacterium nasicanis]|uniref:Helix-turn-helix domain-containing protein n=1 Tax=Corynebacterium nasicanis TaxID=1448267 RepID=A0ABW1QDZ1_9CORY
MGRATGHVEDSRAARELAGISPSDYSEALERGLAVFEAFKTPSAQLTQADVARTLDLPRATVRRTLVTLTHLGYLAVEGRTYHLTPKVLDLASAYLISNPITRILQPLCERVANEFGVSSTVAVLDKADAVMIARALPEQSVTLGVGLGYRVPGPQSALGRVLLSVLDEADRRERIIASLTDMQEEDMEKEVSRIQNAIAGAASDGFSYVADEVDLGFHSVAVPLLRWDGAQIAALNVGTTPDKISAVEMTGPVRARLQEIARQAQPQLI